MEYSVAKGNPVKQSVPCLVVGGHTEGGLSPTAEAAGRSLRLLVGDEAGDVYTTARVLLQ